MIKTLKIIDKNSLDNLREGKMTKINNYKIHELPEEYKYLEDKEWIYRTEEENDICRKYADLLQVNYSDDNETLQFEMTDDIELKFSEGHIYISYPLSVCVQVDIENIKSYYDILKDIKTAYQYIYDFETESSSIKADYLENSLNRNSTDGVFGIWGHVIEDLIVEGVYIKNNNVFLGIGS